MRNSSFVARQPTAPMAWDVVGPDSDGFARARGHHRRLAPAGPRHSAAAPLNEEAGRCARLLRVTAWIRLGAGRLRHGLLVTFAAAERPARPHLRVLD